jgi:hypothetical protein
MQTVRSLTGLLSGGAESALVSTVKDRLVSIQDALLAEATAFRDRWEASLSDCPSHCFGSVLVCSVSDSGGGC